MFDQFFVRFLRDWIPACLDHAAMPSFVVKIQTFKFVLLCVEQDVHLVLNSFSLVRFSFHACVPGSYSLAGGIIRKFRKLHMHNHQFGRTLLIQLG
jgi:hypothetical protein